MIFGKAIGLHLLGVMQYGQVCGYWEFLELVRSKSMNKIDIDKIATMVSEGVKPTMPEGSESMSEHIKREDELTPEKAAEEVRSAFGVWEQEYGPFERGEQEACDMAVDALINPKTRCVAEIKFDEDKLKEMVEKAKAEIMAEQTFTNALPPEDDEVRVNEHGLVIMSIATLAKLQNPDTLRSLQEAVAKAHYKLFTKGQTDGR